MYDFAQQVFCKNTLFALLMPDFLVAQNYLQEELFYVFYIISYAFWR